MRSFTRLARLQHSTAIRANFVNNTSRRTFLTTPRLALKEDRERSGEEADRVKHEQIEKQKKGEGHWHKELASNSEEHIAADRQEIDDHDSHIEDLQKETAQEKEKEHHEEK